MQQFRFFIQKYNYFIFFLLLEFLAIIATINNHRFHKSKVVNSVNSLTGAIFTKTNSVADFLSLQSQNEVLSTENTRLKNTIEALKAQKNEPNTPNNATVSYVYAEAKIIKNSYLKPYNYLTLNKGLKHGIVKEMAVVNSKGLLGITDDSSQKYSRVQSVLNRNSQINVRLKNSFHYGSLSWDGKDYRIVQLTDIPRQAAIHVGDTVMTGGRSTIFPEGILVGTVESTPTNATMTNATFSIRLFNDMSNVGHVYVITHLDAAEIKSLENNPHE